MKKLLISLLLVLAPLCLNAGEYWSPNGEVSNAATADSLSANPTDCLVGEAAVAIDAQANLTCLPFGQGDVIGPLVGTDNAIARFDGDGQHLSNSGAFLSDLVELSGLSAISMSGLTTYVAGSAITPGAFQCGRDTDGAGQIH